MVTGGGKGGEEREMTVGRERGKGRDRGKVQAISGE